MKKNMILALVALSVAQVAQARIDNKTKPILLVHGWSATQSGYDCNKYFAETISALKAQGYSHVSTVSYYSNSKNCSINLQNFDSKITNDSSFKVIGASLSRYINQTYTSTGQVVDLAGHSMGGLIIRSAIQGALEQQVGFAPIMIEDALTIATPHTGTSSANYCWSTQCRAMLASSAELKWLASNGNPQSLIATDWTVMGSTSDSLVKINSALAMNVDANHKATYSGLSHLGILKDTAVNARAGEALLLGSQ